MQTTQFIQSSREHNHGELSDPLCDSVNRSLTLVRLAQNKTRPRTVIHFVGVRTFELYTNFIFTNTMVAHIHLEGFEYPLYIS